MKFETKSFDEVELEAASTVTTNKEQIKERKVICKSCNHEFTVSEVIKHNTHMDRGYCYCPACQQINDIRCELYINLAEKHYKKEINAVNEAIANIGRK